MEAFCCTDLQAPPVQIREWVIRRWSVEVPFEEARAHLGFGTPRQGSDKAIARTTPALFGIVRAGHRAGPAGASGWAYSCPGHGVVPETGADVWGLSGLGT